MGRQVFKTEGFKELDVALGDLVQSTKSSTGRTVLRKSMQQALVPMADHARALAPELKGGLRRGIKIGGKLSRSQARSHVRESELEVFMGPNNAPKAIAQEFGTVTNPPQSYIRPAWDAGHGALLGRMREALWALIAAAAALAARRSARKR